MRADIRVVPEPVSHVLDPFSFGAERELAAMVGPGTLMLIRRLLWIFDGVEDRVTVPVDVSVVAELCGVKSEAKVRALVKRACRFRLLEHLADDEYELFRLWPQPGEHTREQRQLMESHVIYVPRTVEVL